MALTTASTKMRMRMETSSRSLLLVCRPIRWLKHHSHSVQEHGNTCHRALPEIQLPVLVARTSSSLSLPRRPHDLQMQGPGCLSRRRACFEAGYLSWNRSGRG